MDIDFEAEDWFGNPAPEETLRQQLSLVETENYLLRGEVERYRVNQAKLIRMLAQANDERDSFRREAESSSKTLSRLYLDNAQLKNEVNGLHFMNDRAARAEHERAAAQRLAGTLPASTQPRTPR